MEEVFVTISEAGFYRVVRCSVELNGNIRVVSAFDLLIIVEVSFGLQFLASFSFFLYILELERLPKRVF